MPSKKAACAAMDAANSAPVAAMAAGAPLPPSTGVRGGRVRMRTRANARVRWLCAA
jgi:hypothetical protein